MDIVHTIEEVRERVGRAKSEGKKVGFVPTMGYLHKGHLSLVEIAKKECGYVAMSIFVNRIQFNDKKDFENYPVDLKRDFDLAKESGVNLMFVPEESQIYRDHLTYVNVEGLTENLCGACRPGHFQGVFTVVSKLFNIVGPQVAVFGQKDIQQAVSIEKMVKDLNFPVKIVIAPIVREHGGLAMSSRNKHLSEENRDKAFCIFRSLKRAEELIQSGERDGGVLLGAMQEIISGENPDKIDYITLADYSNLKPVGSLKDKSVIAVAVFFGGTRLIDNMIVEMKGGKYNCRF